MNSEILHSISKRPSDDLNGLDRDISVPHLGLRGYVWVAKPFRLFGSETRPNIVCMHVFIQKRQKHLRCEIGNFLEAYICKLIVMLQSRVLQYRVHACVHGTLFRFAVVLSLCQCAMCNVQWAMGNGQCAMCSARCAMCKCNAISNLQFAICNPHCHTLKIL